MVVGLIVAQTFVRGCVNVLIVVAVFQVFDGSDGQVGYLTAAIGVGGLVGALGAMTLKGSGSRRSSGSRSSLGPPAHAHRAAALLRSRRLFCSRSSAPRTASRTSPSSPAAADRPGRDADAGARPRVGPGDGRRRARLDRGAGRREPRRAACRVRRRRLDPAAADAASRTGGSSQLDRSVAPAAELELIERVPMFAPLSLAAKEHVASHLVPVAAAAGELVIRAGDVGDRFYIVADGELDIDVDGRHIDRGPRRLLRRDRAAARRAAHGERHGDRRLTALRAAARGLPGRGDRTLRRARGRRGGRRRAPRSRLPVGLTVGAVVGRQPRLPFVTAGVHEVDLRVAVRGCS